MRRIRIMCVFFALCILLTACKDNAVTPSKNLPTLKPTLPSLNNSTTDDVGDNDSNDSNFDDSGEYEESSGRLKGSISNADKSSDSNSNNVDINRSGLLINKQKGAYDKVALDRRKEIQNTKDNLDLTGLTVYYAAPDGDNNNDGLSPETPLNGNDITNALYLLRPGTALLFKRGGIYRPGSLIEIQTNNVTIGAYGEGPKPEIYGSLYNYSEKLWEPTKTKNVWRTSVRDVSSANVIFNEGEAYGWMKYGIKSLMNDGDFFHNSEEGYFYLYSSKGNPSDVWYDIEIAPDRSGIGVWGGAGYNITIDNICIKYFGRHGFQFYGQNHDITVTNCEVGWIGGALQNAATFLRYGNGIEFYGGNSYNLRVENNWVYQTYDSGITIQNGATTSANLDGGKGTGGWTNVTFKNNVVEFMEACLEIWNSSDSDSAWYKTMEYKDGKWVKRDVPLTDNIPADQYRTFGFFDGIYVVDNILRFAGFGWSYDQRPLKSPMTITMWFAGDAQKNFNIKNNVFDFSRDSTFSWLCHVFAQTKDEAAYLETVPGRGLNVSGNTFFMKPASNGTAVQIGPYKGNREKYAVNQGRDYQSSYYAFNQADYELAIAQLDPSPKLVKYYD